MEWRHSGSPSPKKFREQKSSGKVLASIFWDQIGFPLTDYLPKGQTINAECCSSLLIQLKDFLKEKRRERVTKAIFFLHNAPAHWALATQKKLAYLGFQRLDHPPSSRDLAPLDYHLFPGLKKTIEMSPFYLRRGNHCCRGDLVGQTTFRFFFLSGVQKLEQRARNCMSFVGSMMNKSRVWSL